MELEVASTADPEFSGRLVGALVNVFVLHAAPQPLDNHVVDPAAFPIQADRHVVVFEDLGERISSRLRALVSVEDLGRTVACNGFLVLALITSGSAHLLPSALYFLLSDIEHSFHPLSGFFETSRKSGWNPAHSPALKSPQYPI